MIAVDGTLAGLRVRHRDAGRRRKSTQLRRGLGVDRAASTDEQGALGGANRGHRPLEGGSFGRGTAHVPDTLVEELQRPVVGLGLHVLRQRDGAGFRRVGEDTHGTQQGGNQLLGSIDAIEEARHRAERVVDGDIQRRGILKLLQNRIGDTGGELVGGEDEDGQAIGGRQGRTGHHVEGSGADRCGRHPGLEAIRRLGIGGGRVHRALLVARHDIGHRVLTLGGSDLVLQQGLPDSGDVAVPEDSESSRDEAVLNAVALGVLVGQETNDRLGDCESHHPLVGVVAHG